MTWNPKDLSEYANYDHEQKMSICKWAFDKPEHLQPASPPHERLFYLARTIGYKIPEKWKDIYPAMVAL